MAESKNEKFLRGAALLAATVAIVKVIGAIYKIPLYNLLGDEGTTHFTVTYTIYSLLLSLATSGVPIALSRLISSSSELGHRRQVSRYFKVAMVMFLCVGVVCTSFMLFFPKWLAELIGDPGAAMGIMVLAPAVLFDCVVAVYRGYSQGHSNMVPTAISQIMEVSCKLVFGLALALLLAKLGYGSEYISAGAIFGVTLGMGLAIPILAIYKKKMDRRITPTKLSGDVPLSRAGTCAKIVKVGLPIMLSSSVMNMILLIDTKLILLRLQSGAGFSFNSATVLYGVYSKAATLFSLPTAFIVPVTVSAVPAIAAALARKNRREAREVMESSLKVTHLVALPAGVGMCVLAYPIFNVLYPGSNENGPGLLASLAIASILVCTYLMTSAILQASGHEKLALITLPVGGVIKIAINWFLVGNPAYNISGAPVSTIVCYLLMTLLNVVFIIGYVSGRPNFLKTLLGPLLCTGLMGVTAWSIYQLSFKMLSGTFGDGRMGMLIYMGIAIVFAMIVYGILIVATKTVTREDLRLLPKGEKIANLLKMR